MSYQKSADTRNKLLAAACEVFADKGFRDATVSEICSRAEVNVAAVNYHFGSKEALYREAWRHSFEESLKAYPHDGGVSADAPAEERLKGAVKSLLARIADNTNKNFIISHMELTNPTGLLAEVMEKELFPLREKTLALVREILGPGASGQEVTFCEVCLTSMCIQPLIFQKLNQNSEKIRLPILIDDVEKFADHVVKFALSGFASFK